MTSKRVNDLRSRVGDIERQLHDAKERLWEALLDEAPVKAGDIVVDRKGARHRITRVTHPEWSPPWVEGNPLKKDGTFGIAVRNLCSAWALVEPAASPAEGADA